MRPGQFRPGRFCLPPSAAELWPVLQSLHWAWFTAANLVAITAYFSAELAFTALLFGIYLGLGLLGWRAWWLAEKRGGGTAKTEGRA